MDVRLLESALAIVFEWCRRLSKSSVIDSGDGQVSASRLFRLGTSEGNLDTRSYVSFGKHAQFKNAARTSDGQSDRIALEWLMSTPIYVLVWGGVATRWDTNYLQGFLGGKKVEVRQEYDSLPQLPVRRVARSNPALIVKVSVLSFGLVIIAVIALPSLLHLSSGAREALEIACYFTWVLVGLGFCVKLVSAGDEGYFVTQGIFDLAMVALPLLCPFWAASDLLKRCLRSREALVGKVVARARSNVRQRGFHYAVLMVIVLVFAASALEWQFEAHASGSNIHSYGDALWWAVTTISTVGYGDRFPVTAGGRGVAVVLMVTGIAMFGVLTATISSHFTEQREHDARARINDLAERLDRIEALMREGIEMRLGEYDSIDVK